MLPFSFRDILQINILARESQIIIRWLSLILLHDNTLFFPAKLRFYISKLAIVYG